MSTGRSNNRDMDVEQILTWDQDLEVYLYRVPCVIYVPSRAAQASGLLG